MIFFGFPGRTAMTAIERVTIPPFDDARQSWRDEPGILEHLHVGLERERDDVGLEALLDRAGLRARALVARPNFTSCPVFFFHSSWKAGMIASPYASRGVV